MIPVIANSARATPTTPSLVHRLREGERDRRRVDPDPQRVLRLPVLVDVRRDGADEQVGEHRHDRQRANQRGEQRERDGEGERQEELAHEAADEAQWQEHADGRDRRGRDRAGDLLRPVDRGRQTVLAHRPVAVDVLEDDDRVVDYPTHGDRQAAQGHDVQGDPSRLHDDEGGEDRERDADRGDDRRADAEQEQEDRQDREHGAEAALAQEAVARLLDERRQVRDDGDRRDVGVLLARACRARPSRRPRPGRYSRRRSSRRTARPPAGRWCARSHWSGRPGRRPSRGRRS